MVQLIIKIIQIQINLTTSAGQANKFWKSEDDHLQRGHETTVIRGPVDAWRSKGAISGRAYDRHGPHRAPLRVGYHLEFQKRAGHHLDHALHGGGGHARRQNGDHGQGAHQGHRDQHGVEAKVCLGIRGKYLGVHAYMYGACL